MVVGDGVKQTLIQSDDKLRTKFGEKWISGWEVGLWNGELVRPNSGFEGWLH